jgi:hypothetical protein
MKNKLFFKLNNPYPPWHTSVFRIENYQTLVINIDNSIQAQVGYIDRTRTLPGILLYFYRNLIT